MFGPIALDLDMHIARVEGEALDLTRREFELLAYFLQNPRRVLSREKILQQVWGLDTLGESRTIDAHVRRVRAKLGDAAAPDRDGGGGGLPHGQRGRLDAFGFLGREGRPAGRNRT